MMTADKQKYRFGIVGCGTIATVHAEAIRSSSRAELVAACSRSAQNLQKFCRKFNIKGYTDYDAFLADDLDAVVLCTPNGTHLDYGLKAADYGKSLVIEKPLEVNIEKGKKLVEYCKDRNVQLAVIYQNRFIAEVRKLKQVIDDGTIGELVMISASVKWFRDQAYYQNAPWRGSLKLDGGGALINQSIHTVDLMLWIAGPVESVCAFKATLTHDNIEGEDNLVASMRFKNGALGTFEASTSITPSQNRKIAFHGTEGTVILDGDVMQIYAEGYNQDEAGKAAEKVVSGGSSSPLAGFTNSHHTEQYKQIIAQMERGLQPPVSGEESLNALAFIQAAYQSAEQHSPVNPDSLHTYIIPQKV
ncbi:MAG: Gfo/Idh/MocA family oxidoreductase [Balneolales bacterium]|nr:Gfo/Idh/MocA family oxidoreductase [Balneolales bacterium]